VLKKLALLVLLLPLTASAHVLATTAYSVSGGPGVTSCYAPHITMTAANPTYGPGGALTAISITYSLGTATFTGSQDTSFAVAACAPTYTNTLNLSTGQWTLTMTSAGYGQSLSLTGTLSTSQLAAAVTTYNGPALALRNSADQFLTLSGAGLLTTPFGTQPATW